MRRHWLPEDLVEHFTLLPAESALLAHKTGPTRLGFAVLLKCFQYDGHFPVSKQEVPEAVVAHLAQQVGVLPEQYLQYDWSGRTIKYHRAQIRAVLGFRQATGRDARNLAGWLDQHVIPHEHRASHLKDAAYQQLRALRIEPPSPDRLDRLIRSARHTHETRLCAQVLMRLSPATLAKLDMLLGPTGPEASGTDAADVLEPERSIFTELKRDAGPAGVDSLLAEVGKLKHLGELDLPDDLFQDLSPKVLSAYRQRAAAEPRREMLRHPPQIRYTLLAAYCQVRREEITDILVELLIQLVHRIGARAERNVVKELLEDLRRVQGKTGILFRLAEAAVTYPDGVVREVLYPVVGEQTLHDLVQEFKSTGTAYRLHVQNRRRASYRSHYRQLLPHLLHALAFRSNTDLQRPTIEALEVLRAYANSPLRFYPDAQETPIAGVVPHAWHDFVVKPGPDGRERVDRIAYEICVLHTLRERLRSKEIWVVGAHRYRNPDEDLPTDFEAKRLSYYEALHQPFEVDTFIARLRQVMEAALRAFDAELPRNRAVKLLPKGRGWIQLSPLTSQPEPVNLARLKAEIAVCWPMTSLLDMLKETALCTAFTEHFKSVASRESLERDTLHKRLLLCLYALGINLGIKCVSAGDHGEKYTDLVYVRRRYLHNDQLRQAIAHVGNAIFQVRLPQLWGEATTACASDSKQFGAWDQNLLTEWHIRYGGRGIMIYWHVERKSAYIYSQLKQCSSSEVAAMIEGILRHCTDMAIEKQYVDSHGQSHVAFAFCYLPGFRLLPRLKAIHAQRLYRSQADRPAVYPNLQLILTRPINWALIREQYDEMIKDATALRLGTADAEAILRRFTRSNLLHPTYQALSELGKAVKTMFLCEYLRMEALRYEIQEALNVIELWTAVNGFLLYGKAGEIATNRQDEQELSMLALHLLQNCLVYINTLMIQRVLTEPAWHARLTMEDLRGLTPLIYAHVNPYGSFRLDMQERLTI